MKTNTSGFPKLLWTLILIVAVCALVQAQTGGVDLSSIDSLAARAVDKVDMTFDGSTLKMATKFSSEKQSADEEKFKEILSMVTSVQVKHLKFGNENDISDADLQPVRAQLQSPDWSKAAVIRSRKDGENIDVFLKSDANVITNLVVIVREPKELTVVNLAGSLDPKRLSALIGQMGGKFGIPQIDLGR